MLLGWSLGNEVLKRILPGLVAMNPVTALGFILAGASLLCYWLAETKPAHKWESGRAMGGVLVVVGTLKLSEYILGWHLAFDQTLFQTQLQRDGTGFPNQIAPNTAFNFILSGLALWFLNAPVRRFSRWGQNLSLTLAFVSLVPLVGYIYQASYLYSIGSYIPMALHTAALFFLLALGMLLAQTDYGVVALFTSQTPGGAIARRLLPFAFAVPIALGALTIWTTKQKIYPVEFGITVVVVGCIAIFTGLIWWNAILLNRADDQRRQAEEALQKAHDKLEVRVLERTATINNVNAALRTQIHELQRAEEKIREQVELLDKAQDAIIVLDLEDRVVYWNKSAERIYGWSANEVIGQGLKQLLFRGDSPPELQETIKSVNERGDWVGELKEFTKDGRQIIVQARPTLIRDGEGRPKGVLIINTDITERKLLEEQFLRAQRLESLGVLVSGIAHDLNNTLSPILMGTNILFTKSPPPETESILNIMEASARRSKDMVKQMLAFARGGELSKMPVNSGQLVKEMGRIIADTFPKSIRCRVQVDTLSWPVSGLPTQLHQVLLNLCVNARDAMPDGGTLTLSTKNVQIKPKDAALHPDTRPENYLCVSVADTGTGIPAGQLEKIFEPFFTTKAPGKGTGLGLSTSLGIVRNHDGFMTVHSEVGRGTEFKIYLPAATETPGQTPHKKALLPPGNGERILILDDEEAFLAIMRSALENYSYKVLTASSGVEALAHFSRNPKAVNLIITDLDMPFMDGRAVIAALRKIRRDVKVIAASGTEKDAENFLKDVKPDAFISKPFTSESLLETVYQVLTAKE